MATLLTCLILAVWMVGFAILSVQNYQLVSLKFLIFQSVQVPVGIVLALSVVVGMVLVSVAQLVWEVTALGRGSRRSFNRAIDEDEGNW